MTLEIKLLLHLTQSRTYYIKGKYIDNINSNNHRTVYYFILSHHTVAIL